MKDVENHNNQENIINFSFSEDMFEKFGERRLFSRGEYFVRSGEVMKSIGWIVKKASNTRSHLLTGTTGLLAFPSMI